MSRIFVMLVEAAQSRATGHDLDLPDFGRIFGDRAVAGEFSGAGHVQDRLPRPCVGIGIQFAESLIGLEVGSEVSQVHVEVAVRQERVAEG